MLKRRHSRQFVPQKTGGKNNVQDTPPASPQSEQQSRSLQETEPTPQRISRLSSMQRSSTSFASTQYIQTDIFTRQSPPQYHPGYYPSGPDYLPSIQQSPWRPQYIDIPERRSCYDATGADPRVAFRGALSLEHRSGIADFIRNVRRKALSNGTGEITVNFPAN